MAKITSHFCRGRDILWRLHSLSSLLEICVPQLVQCTINITDSAVVRRTSKVNGKWRILTTKTSKSLIFFKFELDVHDYVHYIYASENFHFSPFSEDFSPDRWNVTVLWIVCYTLFFLGHAPRSNPWMNFNGLWLIWRVFAQGRFFWGCENIIFSLGVISPKNSPKGGMNFKPNRPNIKNRNILQSLNRINMQF